MPIRRILRGVGKTLISLGLLILAFVAYQLWGTNFAEARSQNKLLDQWESIQAKAIQADTGGISSASTTTTTTLPPENKHERKCIPPSETPRTGIGAPTPGQVMGKIEIPAIGLQKTIVEGVEVEDLKQAPGHYPTTVLPGQPGNAGIAGHRTTYGAPFNRIDELQVGDEICVTTLQGKFVYTVFDKRVVSPDDTEVLAPTTDNRLTLTTCHPKYSAEKRFIVFAHLEGEAAEITTTTTVSTTSTSLPTGASANANPNDPTIGGVIPGDEAEQAGQGTTSDQVATLGDSWHTEHLPVAILWALLVGLVSLVIWFAARLWIRPLSYLFGAPVFVVALFIFYEYLAKVLPADF